MWKATRALRLQSPGILSRKLVRSDGIHQASRIGGFCVSDAGAMTGMVTGRAGIWTRGGGDQNWSGLWSDSNQWRRSLCRKTGDPGVYKPPPPLPETDEELERIPVPDGVPTDRFGTYSVQGFSRGHQGIKPSDGLFAVHGPSEAWAPYGLVKGHGAGGGIFAMITVGARPYQVIEGDVLYTNRIKGEVNTTYVFDDVLALGAVDWSWIGSPLIAHASVVSTIEEQAQSGKIYITKFKKRTGYRRRMGHRQLMTRFRIDEIRFKLPNKSDLEVWEPRRDPHSQPPNFMFKW